MKGILCTNREVVKVDDKDYEYLDQFKWRVKKDRYTWYAYRTELKKDGGRMISMHREIMNTPDHLQVDHRDHNGLNNQKSNLRNCTRNDNCRNVYSRNGSSSKYLGVSKYLFLKKDGTISEYCQVGLTCDGILYRLGHFINDEEAAARAYDKKARELFGEFANLNFP